ncbi:helix-turn-helix domain-containing protein [Glycomyces sp. NRRL B-16210]|uniref:helix-turn-helix domain-containing protein n=1 Tax=Glycomyces sp. NRRL B-16210 TaxID=1463821 RepID=UPI0004C04750|nr:helix-turn-helix transcriptional regulator [Glycomyces sp. NRRL B-16210]
MTTVGGLLREWRQRRRMSQFELALAAEVSARHVSLVETGKSRPSAAMVLRLAETLDVPLRERNRLLLAAGHAPEYPERPLTGPDLGAARGALEAVLRAHEPYPAVVIDGRWNIVMTNRSLRPFLAGIAPELLEPPVNLVRLGLHPEGLASRIVNLGQVRAVLRGRLSRQLERTRDPDVAALYEEFLRPGLGEDDATVSVESEITTPMIIRHNGFDLRLFSTITTFGTPRDITLEGIAVEMYYPADEQSAAVLRDPTLTAED